MRRAVWLTVAVAINAILAAVSQAQTNSCITSVDGFWDEARLWSLAEPPSIAQSAILITNAASETVTIDSITANSFTSTLTVSNLSINPPSGSTDTLYLDDTGAITLHILDGLTIGISPDSLPAGGAELISTNSALIVDGLLGGQLQDSGTMVITGGSLITTNCSLQVGAPFAAGLLIISNASTQARDVSIVGGEDTTGTIEVIGGTMTLSSFLSLGGSDEGSQGSLLVANGGLLVVTNDTTYIGEGFECSGSITVTNATMLADAVLVGAGFHCGGGLFIEDGTVTLEGSLDFGSGSIGEVSLNGGLLVITNNTTTVGGEENSGAITIEEGLFLAREILVGSEFQSDGILTVNGGATQLSSYLQVGRFDGLSGGGVFLNGGQLVVTNDDIIVERGATITVSVGLLAANHIDLGVGRFATGTLSINGGSVTALTGITLGDCASNNVGQIILCGGQLTVTNAASTGFIDIQNGQLVLSGGILRVDKLVMTNTCGNFIHTGGTLIVGSVVLNPNAFQITSITQEGNNLRITWFLGPGQTNALQAASGGIHGAYTTNSFADIFVVTNNTTIGCLTNYLDIGVATNKPSRFYRARLSP
jgi:hypothetical protein